VSDTPAVSDTPSYGTADKPWPELPPAASLYAVHWPGGLAVEFGDKDGPPVATLVREPVALRR
jgi:hypothetical protein